MQNLKDFLSEKSVPMKSFLYHLIVDGVPVCGKTSAIHKLLSDSLTKLPPGDNVATIGERNDTGLYFMSSLHLKATNGWLVPSILCIPSAFSLLLFKSLNTVM